MNESDIIFQTERSLEDYAELYDPRDCHIAVLRHTLRHKGLDALNLMLREWYPPGDKNHHVFVMMQKVVAQAGAATPAQREYARLNAASLEPEEVEITSAPAFFRAT